MRFDKRLLVCAYILLNRDRLISRSRPISVQRGAKLVEIEVQSARNQRKIGINILVLLAHQEARNRWIVIDNQPVLAIKQLATRGQHRHLSDAVLLGQQLKILRTKNL